MMPYQQRRSLGAIETEGLIGRQVAAGADPDLEPTATHQIEYRGVLSHSDRQLERQRHDPGPQADARRPGSDLGEKHKRCRQAAFVLVKMVLRHPCGVKAAAFRMHDLRGGQAIALGCIRLIEQASEKAKAQRRLRYGPCHVPGRRRSRSGRIGSRQELTW
jgi:hypothetical protein